MDLIVRNARLSDRPAGELVDIGIEAGQLLLQALLLGGMPFQLLPMGVEPAENVADPSIGATGS